MQILITPAEWKFGFNDEDPEMHYLGAGLVSDGMSPLAASPGAGSKVPPEQKRANIILMSYAPKMLEMLNRISVDPYNGYNSLDGIGTIGGDLNALTDEIMSLISRENA